MSMNIVIHALEALLGLLVAMMSVQIARQYNASVSVANERRRSAERSEFLASHNEAKDEPIVVSLQSKSSAPKASSSPASQILDDYIGGFFGEPEASDYEMKAFRNVEKSEAESLMSPSAGNDQISCVAPAVDLSAYKANKPIFDDNIPTLHSPIPVSMLTERFVAKVKELDDEVILVDEPKMIPHASGVMSDKVVMAMLDEAKLAGTS